MSLSLKKVKHLYTRRLPMKKDRKNSGAYAKIFEEWNKNRTPLTLNGEDFTYIPESGVEFRQ